MSNIPVFVRRSFVIYAPTPNFSPMSAQRVLMYVPFEQLTSIVTLLPFISKMSIEFIVTLRGLRSTSIPCLANSYSFLPFCFIAEYIGGICSISPTKLIIAAQISSPVTFTSVSVKTSPSASSVSVVLPKTNSAVYALSDSVSISLTFVAEPMQIGSTPVAIGSSVPV